MKAIRHKVVFFFIFLATTSTFAQVIDSDAAGDYNLLYENGSVIADLQRACFSANYTKIPANKYYSRSPVWGINLLGRERTGASSLLENGFTATELGVKFTAGISFMSEYINKYKPKNEYEAFLNNEKEALEELIKYDVSDTSVAFTVINNFDEKYAAYTDSLKLWYIKMGAQREIFEIWRNYAERVVTRTGEKGFAYEVDNLILHIKNTRLPRDIEKSRARLEKINFQLNTIEVAPQSFFQTTLFATAGLGGFSFKEATFEPKPNSTDSTVVFSNSYTSTPYLALGLNHNVKNKFFLGVKLGLKQADNFETLSTLQYYTDTILNRGSGQAVQSFTGYHGNYDTDLNYFFSFNISYVDKIGDWGNVALTPIYLTLGKYSSTYGSSINIITKHKFMCGVNIEVLTTPSSQLNAYHEATRNISVGLKLGYALVDFNFANR